MLDLTRRIRRPEELDDFLKDLTAAGSAFENMADALVYAGALAYEHGLARRPFDKTGEQIPATVFLNAGYDSLINMLAAEVADDYDVLLPDRTDERLRIFEEYAAAGLYYLKDLLERDSRRPKVEVLRDLTLDAYKEKQGDYDTDFEQLLNELEK